MYVCTFRKILRPNNLAQRNTRVSRIRALFCKVEVIISFDARGSDRSLSIVLKL